jgi:aromatic amino acid aminotransferase I
MNGVYETGAHCDYACRWTRCVLTLLNDGEGFLTEEWTYPSAVASAKPYNINTVSVPIDAYGMRVNELRKILSEWNETERGMKRYDYLFVTFVLVIGSDTLVIDPA